MYPHMFNRDIHNFFRKADVRPSNEFRATLRNRMLAEQASQPAAQRFPWLRLASASLATLAIGALAVSLVFGPQNSNAALAEAIRNTFGISEEGYHHQKMINYGNYDGHEMEETTEYWQYNGTIIMDTTVAKGDGVPFTSQYLSANDDMVCTSRLDDAPTCATPQLPFDDELVNGDTLEIIEITTQAATDTHGDMYLTWITDHQLKDSIIRISDPDGAGFIVSYWHGTYSWIDDQGRYVNRVTLRQDSMLQSAITQSSSFLVQLVEIEPTDTSTKLDSAILGESPVYRIETGDWTVVTVSDDQLDNIRETTRQRYVDNMTSVETIRRQYENSFFSVFSIQENLDHHKLVDTEQIEVNGHAVDVLTYALDSEYGFYIQTTPATEAQFAIDTETNTILWYTMKDAEDNVLQHAELLLQEERPTAPEGIFDLEAWKARVTAN